MAADGLQDNDDFVKLIKTDDADAVERIAKRDADLVSKPIRDVKCRPEENLKHKFLAVHIAARFGALKVVKKLCINMGVDADARDNYGFSPLMWAAKQGHAKVCFELASIPRVEINARDKRGWNAIMYASTAGHANVVKAIAEGAGPSRVNINAATPLLFIYNCSALYFAAREGHDEVVREMLAQFDDELDINQADMEGRTPLMLACKRGRAGVVRELLMRGEELDLNAKDDEMNSALTLASQGGHTLVLRALVSMGSALDLLNRDRHGKTGLHLAITHKHPAAVRILLDAGTNARLPDSHAITAVDLMEETDNEEIRTIYEVWKTKDKERAYVAAPTTWEEAGQRALAIKAARKKEEAEAEMRDKIRRGEVSESDVRKLEEAQTQSHDQKVAMAKIRKAKERAEKERGLQDQMIRLRQVQADKDRSSAEKQAEMAEEIEVLNDRLEMRAQIHEGERQQMKGRLDKLEVESQKFVAKERQWARDRELYRRQVAALKAGNPMPTELSDADLAGLEEENGRLAAEVAALEGGAAAATSGSAAAGAGGSAVPGLDKPPREFTVGDVKKWVLSLADSSLAKYADVLEKEGVDGNALFELTDKDLSDIGVNKWLHRKRLTKAIKALLK